MNAGSWEEEVGNSAEIVTNLDSLLPDEKTMSHDLNKSYYHYRGSLTVPPCTEGVEHFVLRTPVFVPKVTLDMISSKSMARGVTENNRAVNANFNDLVQYVDQKDECD